MARLIINDILYDLKDGEPIRDICASAGVPLNCNSGVCGSCLVKVLEGAQNLNPLTDEEKDLSLDVNSRLACMCVIRQGMVKIVF
ncbi:MAG: (2Fe-2S)-binding protein [Candidatus Omnitrophica bacterium]|nr:(2Fe-2S)-binding protein [Candidatus Omnitrophota bacterium]